MPVLAVLGNGKGSCVGRGKVVKNRRRSDDDTKETEEILFNSIFKILKPFGSERQFMIKIHFNRGLRYFSPQLCAS